MRSITLIRQNHALEHATVAMLLQKGMRPPLGGYSTAGGFFIFGKVRSELVDQAAEEALDRLKQGQADLAISPYCGTNLVTGALLSGLLTAAIMGRGEKRLRRVPTAAAAVICATVLSRPLGNAIQHRYTTLADVGGMQIVRIRRLRGIPFVHRISTTVSPD